MKITLMNDATGMQADIVLAVVRLPSYFNCELEK